MNILSIDIFWLNYEDVVKDAESKREMIRKLIKFIGVQDIVNTEKDIDEIVYGSSMTKMKKQYDKDEFSIKDFVRSGKIGDWKSYMTKEQSEIIDALTKVWFNGTDFRYYKELMNKNGLKSKL